LEPTPHKSFRDPDAQAVPHSHGSQKKRSMSVKIS
jgi:hypothetical protein